jgi:uncharacterized protein DUF6391
MLSQYLTDVRRNHALEHATVSLLMGRVGPDLRVAGRASSDGFFLYADAPLALLTECVNEALTRLQRGEAFWAVTPHCGTNIATAGILAGLGSAMVLGNGKRSERIGGAMIASMAAIVISQPVGRWIQKYITTSPDLDGVEIVSIETKNERFYRVRTRRVAPAVTAGLVA